MYKQFCLKNQSLHNHAQYNGEIFAKRYLFKEKSNARLLLPLYSVFVYPFSLKNIVYLMRSVKSTAFRSLEYFTKGGESPPEDNR